MSKHIQKTELVARVAQSIPTMQNATSTMDDAAAAALGVNLTDLRGVWILLHEESVAAHKLATILGLTRGAVTAVLDRLARAGLAKRETDPHDRRAILVSATALAHERIKEIWGPVEREGRGLLETFSLEQLNAIDRFLTEATVLQLKHATRIQLMPQSSSKNAPKKSDSYK